MQPMTRFSSWEICPKPTNYSSVTWIEWAICRMDWQQKLFTGAFPDKFLFGQGVPTGLPTQWNWKHFSLYYDGQFDDPLFITHGFNQLQCACCIRNSARITGKKPGYYEKSWCVVQFIGIQKTTNLGKRSSSLLRGKSLNAKVSQILSMVGSTILYSPFERAVTRPKLNAMQYCYGVGSNFI